MARARQRHKPFDIDDTQEIHRDLKRSGKKASVGQHLFRHFRSVQWYQNSRIHLALLLRFAGYGNRSPRVWNSSRAIYCRATLDVSPGFFSLSSGSKARDKASSTVFRNSNRRLSRAVAGISSTSLRFSSGSRTHESPALFRSEERRVGKECR